MSDLHRLSRYTLARLVQQQPPTRDVTEALRGVGLRDHRDAQILANERVIGRIKDDCPEDMRAAAAGDPRRPKRRTESQ